MRDELAVFEIGSHLISVDAIRIANKILSLNLCARSNWLVYVVYVQRRSTLWNRRLRRGKKDARNRCDQEWNHSTSISLRLNRCLRWISVRAQFELHHELFHMEQAGCVARSPGRDFLFFFRSCLVWPRASERELSSSKSKCLITTLQVDGVLGNSFFFIFSYF